MSGNVSPRSCASRLGFTVMKRKPHENDCFPVATFGPFVVVFLSRHLVRKGKRFPRGHFVLQPGLGDIAAQPFAARNSSQPSCRLYEEPEVPRRPRGCHRGRQIVSRLRDVSAVRLERSRYCYRSPALVGCGIMRSFLPLEASIARTRELKRYCRLVVCVLSVVAIHGVVLQFLAALATAS